MPSKRLARIFTFTVFASCGILLTSTMSAWAAAYKPINLNIPAQLPQATQGKSYTYSLAARVTGGTGKPYKWSFSGALPANLKFNASSGKILGVLISSAAIGSYPLSICVTGGKKGATTKIRNTICKTTSLKVVQGTSPTTPANNASGTYVGNINFPNLNASGTTGCEAKVIARTVTLVEGGGGAITGSTNNEMMPTLTGTRVGSAITVTLQSRWGARGPYTWQWSGDTISGILPAYCWDLSTFALLNEGSYTFTLTRSGTQPIVASASGTYAGNINFPNLTPPSGITGCEAKVIARTVTLIESAGGALTGSTNNEMMPTLTGTRVGSAITVTLQSRWGARGPYTWQWSGGSISGTLPAFCWDLSTYALLNEGSYTFVLQKS